jgi:hypothetical protein
VSRLIDKLKEADRQRAALKQGDAVGSNEALRSRIEAEKAAEGAAQAKVADERRALEFARERQRAEAELRRIAQARAAAEAEAGRLAEERLAAEAAARAEVMARLAATVELQMATRVRLDAEREAVAARPAEAREPGRFGGIAMVVAVLGGVALGGVAVSVARKDAPPAVEVQKADMPAMDAHKPDPGIKLLQLDSDLEAFGRRIEDDANR